MSFVLIPFGADSACMKSSIFAPGELHILGFNETTFLYVSGNANQLGIQRAMIWSTGEHCTVVFMEEANGIMTLNSNVMTPNQYYQMVDGDRIALHTFQYSFVLKKAFPTFSKALVIDQAIQQSKAEQDRGTLDQSIRLHVQQYESLKQVEQKERHSLQAKRKAILAEKVVDVETLDILTEAEALLSFTYESEKHALKTKMTKLYQRHHVLTPVEKSAEDEDHSPVKKARTVRSLNNVDAVITEANTKGKGGAAVTTTTGQEVCLPLYCQLCHQWLKDPCVLQECGHTFCFHCIQAQPPLQSDESRARCKACNKSFDKQSVVKCNALKEVVHALSMILMSGGPDVTPVTNP